MLRPVSQASLHRAPGLLAAGLLLALAACGGKGGGGAAGTAPVGFFRPVQGPPGTTVTKAWAFAKPLDKEGWTDWNLGTQDEEFLGQKWSCIARPVHLVAGGYYVVAIAQATAAHLFSPAELGVDLDQNGLVAIRFQNHTPTTHMRLRFTTKAAPTWTANLGQVFAVTPNDTEARLYTLDLRDTPGWRGELKQLRLDFSDGTPLTGTCRIDYVWLGHQRK